MKRFLLMLLALLPSVSFASLSVEGTVQTGTIGTNTVTLPGITTTGSNEPIVVLIAANTGSTTTSSVSGVSSAHLTFTKRTTAYPHVYQGIEEWTATASGPLSSEVITVTYTISSGSLTYAQAVAFGVLGSASSSYFDTNASIPVATTTGADPTFSTSSANTIVFGAVRLTSVQNPTVGSGWTSIFAGNYFLSEYKVFSSAQSGTTFALTTGSANENGSIVDAIVPPGTANHTGMFFGETARDPCYIFANAETFRMAGKKPSRRDRLFGIDNRRSPNRSSVDTRLN